MMGAVDGGRPDLFARQSALGFAATGAERVGESRRAALPQACALRRAGGEMQLAARCG